jgi:adenosylcobyric acid synthase
MEGLTGKPVIGIVPYCKGLFIEQEDGVVIEKKKTAFEEGKINIGVVLLKHLSNFTDFNMLELMPDVNLFYSDNPETLSQADIIIIPGSKNTCPIENIAGKTPRQGYSGPSPQRETGIRHLRRLPDDGEEVRDPDGVEGNIPVLPGLNILRLLLPLLMGNKRDNAGFHLLKVIFQVKDMRYTQDIHLPIDHSAGWKPGEQTVTT